MARSGLEVLLDDVSALQGARIGVCCNHTAVTRGLVHITTALRDAGLNIVRLFAPEHGVDALAQDMITVEDEGTITRVVSLYGDSEDSLRPDAELLADLDVLLFDIQDIGARYYTYQATLGFIMEVAANISKSRVDVIIIGVMPLLHLCDSDSTAIVGTVFVRLSYNSWDSDAIADKEDLRDPSLLFSDK